MNAQTEFTWIALCVSSPSVDHLGQYTVSFRRQYAYVYCEISRPCGVVIDGNFFFDS